MGEHGVHSANNTVRFERVLPGPIERVWSFLTDAEKRGLWLAGGPMDLRVGGTVSLAWDNSRITSEPTPEKYRSSDHHRLVGVVVECDPPRLLRFTWPEGPGNDSDVRFELQERGKDVLLILTHTRLRDRNELVEASGGWHAHLAILEDRVRGVEPRAFWATYFRFEAEYRERAPAE